MNFLRGCTAVVTGASSGLGAEFARQLAPCAGTIILVARRIDRLESLRVEMERTGTAARVLTYQLDVADEAQTEDFIRWLAENHPQTNLLINNAGLGDHGTFETSEWPRVRAMLQVNIMALTRLSHAMLPLFLRQPGHAAILNVSSIASFIPIPDLAVYAATKAYVTSFSEALRAELRGSGVSVTALCPGPVNTEFGEIANRGGRTSMPAPEMFKVSPQEVVRAGLSAVERDRARVVPGLFVAFVIMLAAATPMFVLRFFFGLRKRG